MLAGLSPQMRALLKTRADLGLGEKRYRSCRKKSHEPKNAISIAEDFKVYKYFRILES